jgi:GDP-mannose 6-dehydrogenase
LNISRAYLRPGFAFGGSCLPKDLRALKYGAKELDVPAPVLESIIRSNELHGESAIELIRQIHTKQVGRTKIGLLGLSFKAGTDDLRESPCVTLAERLVGKGYALQVYDPFVNLERLVGANKAYILREIPHISRLMAPSISALLDSVDVVVIGNASQEFKVLETHKFAPDKVVIDLVGLLKGTVPATVEYHGLCW